MLEKKIEAAVCAYARERGLLTYKFTSPQRSAVPDRLWITPTGTVVFCEFKQEGKKPTPAQEREHARLKGHCVMVFVVDSVAQGRFVVDLLMGEP